MGFNHIFKTGPTGRNQIMVLTKLNCLLNFRMDDRLILLTLVMKNLYYFPNVIAACDLIHTSAVLSTFVTQGLALLTLSWDKNWDSHSLVNGYPSFYPRIALVAPSPVVLNQSNSDIFINIFIINPLTSIVGKTNYDMSILWHCNIPHSSAGHWIFVFQHIRPFTDIGMNPLERYLRRM